MDQLQAFVSEAGSLYDCRTGAEAASMRRSFRMAEQPAAAASPIASAVVEEPATPVDEVHGAGRGRRRWCRMWKSMGRALNSRRRRVCRRPKPPVVAPVASDPYAATAQQILRQLPRGRSQVLLFTSPADGQGKTMTLARLAPLLARGMEGNVLVVDANFRNPDMARWLAVAADVAFAGCSCRRGRLGHGGADDRTRAREPSAGRDRRPGPWSRPECSRPEPSASRSCRPLRPGGRRCVFAGASRHGSTCRRLRCHLSCRAVGRRKSTDASRSGPGRPGQRRPAAGMRGRLTVASGSYSADVLLDGPRLPIWLCSALGDGRSAPVFPHAFSRCPAMAARRSLSLPITLAIVMILILVVLTVGWVLLTVMGVWKDNREGGALYCPALDRHDLHRRAAGRDDHLPGAHDQDDQSQPAAIELHRQRDP